MDVKRIAFCKLGGTVALHPVLIVFEREKKSCCINKCHIAIDVIRDSGSTMHHDFIVLWSLQREDWALKPCDHAQSCIVIVIWWLWFPSINWGMTNFRDSQLLFMEYAAALIPVQAFIIRLQFIKSTCTSQAESGPGSQLSVGSDCSSHTLFCTRRL